MAALRFGDIGSDSVMPADRATLAVLFVLIVFGAFAALLFVGTPSEPCTSANPCIIGPQLPTGP
jgi:hypothetical protein